MIFEIKISNQADADLRGIYEYIAYELQSPDNASGQLDRLEESIMSLDQMPERFREYENEPWHSRGLRIMPVDNYCVLFVSLKEGETIFMEVYYIGGSPCSGKSSITELIAAKHDFTYYKLDDFIFPYMQQAADSGEPISAAQLSMDFEQMWMRDPKLQAQEEFAVYAEIFPYALKDIAALNSQKPIIAEGAGFYPELIQKQGIPANRYICIVPNERFQRENYAKREWIGEYLKGL